MDKEITDEEFFQLIKNVTQVYKNTIETRVKNPIPIKETAFMEQLRKGQKRNSVLGGFDITEPLVFEEKKESYDNDRN